MSIHFDPKKFLSFNSDFEKEIEIEIMKSDRLRARFLSGVFFVLGSIDLAAYLIFPDIIHKFFGLNYPIVIFTTGFLTLSIYEFIYSTTVGHFLKKGIKFPFFPRYLNAFVEISIPTLTIYLIADYFGPAYALVLPPVMAYFIFIGLSALRLDFKLSLFTGITGCAEYICLVFYYIAHPGNKIVDPVLFIPQIHVIKAFLIFTSGCVAAFVAYQIKKRIVNIFFIREEKNRISNIFGQHVSQEVMQKLLSQSSNVSGEVKSVCIMFLDIRNFTSFAQERNPGDVVEYLNTLFNFMIDIVNTNHGIINKFLGDGFMAVFGAPISDGRDCINALNASLEILDALESGISSGKIIETKIGVGLHAGEAVTGNIGSILRKEYTIIGDVVNLASRIEQLNKNFNSYLLISREVYNDCIKEYGKNKSVLNSAVNLGLISVKGREKQIELFKLK